MDYNMCIYEYEKAINLLSKKAALLVDVMNNLEKLIPSIDDTVSIDNTFFNQKELLDIITKLSKEYDVINNIILPKIYNGLKILSTERSDVDAN